MSVSSTGSKGQPQFNSTGNSPTFAADLTATSNHAAEVGNHVVGSTAQRSAYTGWEGLFWSDTDTEIIYRHNGVAFKAWATHQPISFTPTWTGLTIGNGTQAHSYTIAGGRYYVTGVFTFGTTTTTTGISGLTSPANMATSGQGLLGFAEFTDVSATTAYDGWLRYVGTSSVTMGQKNADLTYLRNLTTSATVPFTWTTSDTITYQYTFLPA